MCCRKCLVNSELQTKTGNRAFTLIELLCVILIIAILSAMILGIGVYARKVAFIKRATSQVMQIQGAIVEYKIRNGGVPPTLSNITAFLPQGFAISNNLPLDPWQQPYRYYVNGGEYNVFSMGPDMATGSVSNSGDDIEFKR